MIFCWDAIGEREAGKMPGAGIVFCQGALTGLKAQYKQPALRILNQKFHDVYTSKVLFAKGGESRMGSKVVPRATSPYAKTSEVNETLEVLAGR